MPDDKRIFDKQIPYTVIRNEVFDEVMPKLSYPAWKVLCAILRATMGWRKTEDKLSYSQLLKRTGIKSPSTVSDAIEELVGGGYVKKHGDKATGEANLYELNEDYVLILGTTTSSVDPPSDTTTPSVEVGLQEMETQKKPLNKDTTTTKGPTLSSIWIKKTGQLIQGMAAETIDALEEKYPRDWIIDAIDVACLHSKGPPTVAYLIAILERWKREGKGIKPHGKPTRSAPSLTPEQEEMYRDTFVGSEG